MMPSLGLSFAYYAAHLDHVQAQVNPLANAIWYNEFPELAQNGRCQCGKYPIGRYFHVHGNGHCHNTERCT